MNIISELWYGNVTPLEAFGRNNPALRRVETLLLRNSVKVENLLEDEAKKQFQRYSESQTEYLVMSNEQAFRDGFCLAVKLITEALYTTQPDE